MDQNTTGNIPYQDYAPITMTGEGALLPQNPVVTPTANDALNTISTKPAVITSEPVVQKAQTDLQNLQQAQPQGGTFKSSVEKLAAGGLGSIVQTAEGQRYVNDKGDMYDMNGNLVGSQKSTNASDTINSALGGTNLKPGETEQTMPDGSKIIVDKNGKIMQGNGKYAAGANINQYSESTGLNFTVPEDEEEYTGMQNQLTKLYDNSDSILASQISSIQSSLKSANESQKTANQIAEGTTFNIGITSGRSRYAPDIQTGIMRAQVSAGIKSLFELEAKAQQLIAEAQAAAEERKYKILSTKMDAYQQNRKQKFDETSKLVELTLAYEQAEDEKKQAILDRAKLARENAAAEAELYAPSIIEDISSMSKEQAEDYINKTAEESGVFDAVTLKAAVDAYKRGVAAEQSKGISSYMADYRSLGGQQGTGVSFQQFYASQQAAERAPATETGLISESITGNVPLANAVQNIAQNLTAKNAEMFINNVNRNAANGDLSAVKETLLNASILAVPNAADQSKAIGRVTTLDLLDTIKGDLKRFTELKGDTNILKGTAEQVAQKIGTTTDPELAGLATRINSTIQNYRQFVSGAAFTVPETAEYKSIFPSISKTGELNLAIIEGLSKTYRSALNSQLGLIMGGQTYRDLFGQEGAFAGASGMGLSEGVPSNAAGVTESAREKIIGAGYDYDAIKRDNPKLSDEEILAEL